MIFLFKNNCLRQLPFETWICVGGTNGYYYFYGLTYILKNKE